MPSQLHQDHFALPFGIERDDMDHVQPFAMTTEQKFAKLERTNRHWRWLAGELGLVLAAMFVLPLGLAVAQDNDTNEKPQAEVDRPNLRAPYLQRIQEIEPPSRPEKCLVKMAIGP